MCKDYLQLIDPEGTDARLYLLYKEQVIVPRKSSHDMTNT